MLGAQMGVPGDVKWGCPLVHEWSSPKWCQSVGQGMVMCLLLAVPELLWCESRVWKSVRSQSSHIGENIDQSALFPAASAHLSVWIQYGPSLESCGKAADITPWIIELPSRLSDKLKRMWVDDLLTYSSCRILPMGIKPTQLLQRIMWINDEAFSVLESCEEWALSLEIQVKFILLASHLEMSIRYDWCEESSEVNTVIFSVVCIKRTCWHYT